jgi:hypothetical protein
MARPVRLPLCPPPSDNSEVRADEAEDIVGSGEAAELIFVGHQHELSVG